MQQTLLRIPSFLGVSVEVYVVTLLLIVPIFFVWKKLLRRFIHTANTVVITSVVASIITAPFVYAGAVAIFFAVLLHYPKREFDRRRWLADKEKRYELSADIIQSDTLLGKTVAR